MLRYPYTFEFSPAIEAFFVEKNIFLSHPFRIAGVYKPGERLTIQRQALVEPYSAMCKGVFVSMGAFSFNQSRIFPPNRIGRYCSISWSVSIMAGDHPIEHVSTHPFTYRDYYERRIKQDCGAAPAIAPFTPDRGPVEIGNDVWIGQNVLIRNGLSIGNGAVVAAGAVVVKDVPPYAIVGGNPAKVIRYRFDPEVIAKLQHSEWWRYHIKDFEGLDVADPGAFVDGLAARVAAGDVQPYRPQVIDLAQEIDSVVKSDAAVI
jgi:virginiamycin A acetyltransferase